MLRTFKPNNEHVFHSVKKQLVAMLVRLIAVTFIGWLIVSPLHASACDCYIPENALEALEKSDAVFTGKVKKIKKVLQQGSTYDAVLIEVGETWKGVDESQVIIYTEWSSCQFEFESGQQYLLYAYKVGEQYHVINCGRSTTVAKGAEDIKLLGGGKQPSKEVDLANKFYSWEWLAGAVILAAIVVVVKKYAGKRK